MSDRDDQATLGRALRQRLELLRRTGVDYLPAPAVVAPRRAAPVARAAPAPAPGPAPPPAAVERAEPVERPPSAPASPRPRPQATAPAPAPLAAPALFGDGAMEGPVVPPEERPARLAALAAEVAGCPRCPVLVATRTQTVFGVGSPTARLMFIGEAPGADEDRQGTPFVGRSGQLLTDMITKGMGLTREEVYIANILKCRPPDNRNPLPDEVANCRPYLERQLEIVRPQFLCLLGRVAASTLLDTMLSLARLRGRWHRVLGIPTVVTYHPSYLLRNPSGKKDAWEDLQLLMRGMGLQPPSRRKE